MKSSFLTLGEIGGLDDTQNAPSQFHKAMDFTIIHTLFDLVALLNI